MLAPSRAHSGRLHTRHSRVAPEARTKPAVAQSGNPAAGTAWASGFPLCADALAGMTGGGQPARFTIGAVCGAGAYPRTSGAVASWGVACPRRGVWPTPNVASDRRLEGRPSCWRPRSRRPGPTASGETPAMAQTRWPPSVAQGVIAPYRATGRMSGSQRKRTGTQNAATRVPEGNPGTVRCRAPDKSARGGPRGSPGTGASRSRGCCVRHPRYPSQPRPNGRDGRRVSRETPYLSQQRQ